MTSPQEDRFEHALDVEAIAMHIGAFFDIRQGETHDDDDLAEWILPLFAARVAAIEAAGEEKYRYWLEKAQSWASEAAHAEAEAFEHKEARAELNERCTQYRERSERAGADLTAAQERITELTAELAWMVGHRDERTQRLFEAKQEVKRLEGRVAAERKQAAAQALEQATGESYSPAEITAAVIAVREFFPRIPTGNLIEELRATRALLTATVPATPEETS